MSSDTAKKRKVAAEEYDCGSDHTAVAGVKDIIAEMKVHMTRMQNEMETRVVSMQIEMDSRTSTMQNEIIGMKDRISKMNELEAKCESLERSMKILIDEQKWEYSAPDIPESHWDERGFDGEYIEWMGYLLDKIKEATCELRSGRDMRDEWITVGNDDSDIVLLHDDLLLPHWEELANAMQLYQEGKPLMLFINNTQLTPSVIDLLKSVLKHKPLDAIGLRNNSFVNGRDGIEFAVDVMESNKTIEDFCWSSNAINSMEDARYLVEAVNSHPAINTVRLENCFGNDINGYDILCSLLAGDKNFTYIDLDNNNIRTGGSTEISDLIARNPPLKKLFVTNNNLNDEDVRLMSRALKHNTNLQFISLNRNNITDVGHNALCNAIYDHTKA